MSSHSGRTDLHSHLVPGVDDGARDLEDARAGIQRLHAAGITQIVTTPHFAASYVDDPDRFERVMDRMDAGWAILQRMVAAEFPEISIGRGHEIALDKPDMTFEDERLRLAGTSFALVEWPRFSPPPAAALALQRIRQLGVRPVIAHVERYQGALQTLGRVAAWREAGAFTQVNYGSLVGYYGPEARQVALQLLQRGWVDVLSSDLHPIPGFDVHVEEVADLLDRAGASAQMEILSQVNPGRILADEEPLTAAPLLLTEGFWERFRNFIRRR